MRRWETSEWLTFLFYLWLIIMITFIVLGLVGGVVYNIVVCGCT